MLNAGKGFVTVVEVTGEDGKPDLLLTLDRDKIESVGKPAIGEFLQKLHIYKSLGDEENGRKLYNELSEVKETGPYPFAKWREIVMARRKPRKMFVQGHTFADHFPRFYWKLCSYFGTDTYSVEQKFLLNLETHVPLWQLGCALAALAL